MIDEKRARLQKLKADIIRSIEELDFTLLKKIHIPKNKEEPSFVSFNKIWSWILEVYYNTPVTKYYWPEFKDKVFSKDNGADLKRRMIVYNIKNLGLTP